VYDSGLAPPDQKIEKIVKRFQTGSEARFRDRRNNNSFTRLSSSLPQKARDIKSDVERRFLCWRPWLEIIS
jgi:hypothetical protein